MPGPGKYYGSNPRGVATKSKDKGTPGLAITFHVEHVAGADGQWQQMPNAYDRTIYVWLSDAAWQYSEPKLKALGFNGDFDYPKFTAEGAELTCEIDSNYDGKPREKWELAGGDFTPEKADAETIRDLNRLWRSKQTSTAPTPAGRPSAPPAASRREPAPSGAPADDSEVDRTGEDGSSQQYAGTAPRTPGSSDDIPFSFAIAAVVLPLIGGTDAYQEMLQMLC